MGRVGVEPTTEGTDLQSAAFADSLPTQMWIRRDSNPQPYACKASASLLRHGPKEKSLLRTSTTGFDHLHFDAAGYREMGRRYANQMLTLMGITPKE